ncbi:MAG: Mut7-C RNAse domain-containing protein [Phycisphaerae bacterium]
MTTDGDPPRFFCDAMLGGLARWLRAVGYDAAFEHGIDDGELVQRSQRQGRVILSCDGGLFERSLLRDGTVPSLQVPRRLSKLQQLGFVVGRLGLTRRDARCMACGGELVELPKHAVADEAPPLAFRRCERFWRCERCGKLLWRGTHWHRIDRKLEEVFSTVGPGDS